MRPRLLDLFCGAGGCAMGYHRAGFDVVGVDIVEQPRFPFPFVLMDAMDAIQRLNRNHWYIECATEDRAWFGKDFAAIHASPPCQSYSAMNRAVKGDVPKLIPAVRHLLEQSGKPWVIENVEGADMRGNIIMLCGTMFGVRVRRHRLFECSGLDLVLVPPCECRNGVIRGKLIGHRVAGKVAPGRTKPPYATETDRRDAIGVPWMQPREARQAIPPAYTEFIGKQLIARIQS